MMIVFSAQALCIFDAFRRPLHRIAFNYHFVWMHISLSAFISSNEYSFDKIQCKLDNCGSGRMCASEMNSERAELYWIEYSTWYALKFYLLLFSFNANRCDPHVKWNNIFWAFNQHVLKSITDPAPNQPKFSIRGESKNLILKVRRKKLSFDPWLYNLHPISEVYR